MQVREVMTPNVEFVQSDDSLSQAARKMENLDVGALPVATGGELVGILTDRDIVIRAVAKGLDPEKHKVMEAVSEGVVTCEEGEDVKTVADMMEEKQIRRVVVRDRNAKVAGIVSLGDLALRMHREKSGEVLQEVSKS